MIYTIYFRDYLYFISPPFFFFVNSKLKVIFIKSVLLTIIPLEHVFLCYFIYYSLYFASYIYFLFSFSFSFYDIFIIPFNQLVHKSMTTVETRLMQWNNKFAEDMRFANGFRFITWTSVSTKINAYESSAVLQAWIILYISSHKRLKNS